MNLTLTKTKNLDQFDSEKKCTNFYGFDWHLSKSTWTNYELIMIKSGLVEQNTGDIDVLWYLPKYCQHTKLVYIFLYINQS